MWAGTNHCVHACVCKNIPLEIDNISRKPSRLNHRKGSESDVPTRRSCMKTPRRMIYALMLIQHTPHFTLFAELQNVGGNILNGVVKWPVSPPPLLCFSNFRCLLRRIVRYGSFDKHSVSQCRKCERVTTPSRRRSDPRSISKSDRLIIFHIESFKR